MTEEEIEEIFEQDGEYLKDERILPERRLHRRPDIDAFMRLDKLCPGKLDMVASASHDEIYLEVSIKQLAASGATREDIIDLIRCGVRSSDGHLAMFV